MVQHVDFTISCCAHKDYCHNVRSGKHILLTDCFVISADVVSGEDKIFVCFSNLWSLSSIAQQIDSCWDFYGIAGSATFAEQRQVS